jgi:hypothetical protein
MRCDSTDASFAITWGSDLAAAHSVLKVTLLVVRNLTLLRGRQMTVIALVRSIEAFSKVSVLICPRDVLLFLTAQLRVVALAQPF